MEKLRAIVITGPTASGKSWLATELARRLPLEIVNVDSAQVYRQMDIGTAKPGPDLRREIPHHLIDIRDPSEPYSVADFCKDAIRVIREISERGNTALLTGGTMLYLKALREGLSELPPANDEVRGDIARLARQEGWEAVHRRLAEVDPQAAARIHPGDPQRLQRALEVYELTGTPLTALHRAGAAALPLRLLEIVIWPPDRQVLHRCIRDRFLGMLAAGFLDEVRALHRRGDLQADLPAIKAVGYRQAWAYLEGELDYETMQEKAIIATRQLAKRQFTWLRGWRGMQLLDSPDMDQALKIVRAASILE